MGNCFFGGITVFIRHGYFVRPFHPEPDIPAQPVLIILIFPYLGGFDFGLHYFMPVGHAGNEGQSAAVICSDLGVDRTDAAFEMVRILNLSVSIAIFG